MIVTCEEWLLGNGTKEECGRPAPYRVILWAMRPWPVDRGSTWPICLVHAAARVAEYRQFEGHAVDSQDRTRGCWFRITMEDAA